MKRFAAFLVLVLPLLATSVGHSAAAAEGVTICHKGRVTLTVNIAALPAHLAHGDRIGPCGVVC